MPFETIYDNNDWAGKTADENGFLESKGLAGKN